MFGAPYTGWLVLAFLAAVLVMIGFDYPIGTYTIGSLAIIVPLLIIGWYAWRKDIARIAAERADHTSTHPMSAGDPASPATATTCPSRNGGDRHRFQRRPVNRPSGDQQPRRPGTLLPEPHQSRDWTKEQGAWGWGGWSGAVSAARVMQPMAGARRT